jgi:hypothetical protein
MLEGRNYWSQVWLRRTECVSHLPVFACEWEENKEAFDCMRSSPPLALRVDDGTMYCNQSVCYIICAAPSIVLSCTLRILYRREWTQHTTTKRNSFANVFDLFMASLIHRLRLPREEDTM